MIFPNSDTLKIIQSVKSTRNFSNSPVSSEILDEILFSAVRAPNASNRQNYSIIVVTDQEKLNRFFYGAPLGLMFCVDYHRIIDIATHMGHSYEVYGIFSFVSGAIDTMLAAQSAVIAASALNLDTLFTNSLHRAPLKEIYEIFNLPEKYCFPLLNLCLGYGNETPKVLRGRYKGPGLIHYDRYHHTTSNELDHLIADYDDPLKNIGSNYNHGMEHFFDWFFTKWSAGRYNPQKIEEFHAILKNAGFIK